MGLLKHRKIALYFFFAFSFCFFIFGAFYFSIRKQCFGNNLSYEARIGVLDEDRIWNQLPPVKYLKENLGKTLKKHQKTFSNFEIELRKENQELINFQQSLSLTSDQEKKELERRQKSFSEKVIRLQKNAEELQKKVNDSYEQSMAVIREEINKSIKRNAVKRNLSLVLYNTQLAYSKSSLDITNDVFSDLKDFRYSTVKEL